MWFKNLALYRFTEAFTLSSEELEDKLSEKQFQPCGKQDEFSQGWTSPVNHTAEQLIHASNPQLLDNLDIKGCTVTIDAMGCQTTIAKHIIDKGADYILAVKGNQGSLQQGIADTLRFNKPVDIDTNMDIGHGRIETRICRVYELSDHIENINKWENINNIVEIQAERIIKSTGEKSVEKRHYITSKKAKASTLNVDVRNHWAIENKLHWVLDVTFGEDQSRKRQKFAAENFNTISKIALTLLSNDTTLRKSKKKKRMAAALDSSYREKLLNL